MGQKFSIDAEDEYMKAPGSRCTVHITSNEPLPRTSSLASIFTDIDKDNSSTIEPRELGAYLRKRGITIFTNKQLMDMFNLADDNKDYEITFPEFRRIMNKAEASLNYGGPFTKWKQLFKDIQDEVRPSLEIRLHEMNPYQSATVVSSKPVLGNGTTLITTDISVGFTAGKNYYISLYQIETNLELARSRSIKCLNHASVIAERVQEEMRKEMVQRQKTANQQRRRLQLEKLQEIKLREEKLARVQAARLVAEHEIQKLDEAKHRNVVRLLRDLFNQIDLNSNGKISFLELSSFIEKHAVGHHDVVVDRQNLLEMFHTADVDHSLEIDFLEFQKVMLLAKHAKAGKRWREMYEGFERTMLPRRVRRRMN